MSASEWDDYADEWDNNEDARFYAQNAFASWEKKVAPLYANTAELRVLDFGCGTGLLTELLAVHCGHVVAVDTSAKMIEVLAKKLVSSETGNIVATSFAIDADTIRDRPDLLGNFDLIVASSVCSFLPDYPSTLSALCSIMKSGACFVQWDWMDDMPEERIRGAFAAVGLTVRDIDQAFSMAGVRGTRSVIMGIGQKQP